MAAKACGSCKGRITTADSESTLAGHRYWVVSCPCRVRWQGILEDGELPFVKSHAAGTIVAVWSVDDELAGVDVVGTRA